MASERYNYVLTESAEADVNEAFDYIANELVNPDAADDEKPQKELTKFESVVHSIHTADNKQGNISCQKQDQDDPSKNPFRCHRLLVYPVKPRF